MRERFGALGIPFERFPAVDGNKLSDADAEDFRRARPRTAWAKGQIGCFLSHYNILKLASCCVDEHIAIFEDDVNVSDSLSKFLSDISWIPPSCDVVRFETSTNRVLMSKAITKFEGREVRRVQSTCYCTGGYILSKDAAKKILVVPEQYHNVIDSFLLSYEDSPVPRSLFTAQVTPALCIQDAFLHGGNARFPSTVSAENQTPTFKVRLRHALKKSPLDILMRRVKGYERIDFAA